MTSKYGSENFSLEFRDLQATTMSLDNTGQYALLAGRKYLGILDLNGTSGDLSVRIPYGGKYEISTTQWSSIGHSKILAVASSQRCDIFELTEAELKCTYRLKCHSRVITDIDWSCLQPNLLATSSFDSFVHIWDIRIPRLAGTEKPQQSLSALDGASQVRWNKWKTETLASCDGGHVKIWDMRKPNTPSEYIAAHSMRINGLEWVGMDTVVTAAQDCTVKFSKLANQNHNPPSKSKGPCLTLQNAVWRARPAPFGRGIVTQCVPILRRDSGLLSLWDWKRFSSPIYTFQAYDIVEFAFAARKKTGTFDLITWSRDQYLRVFTPPTEVIELCGEEPWSTNRRSSMNVVNENEFSSGDKGDEIFDEEGEGFGNSSNDQTNSHADGDNLDNDEVGAIPTNRRKSLSQVASKRDELLKAEFESAAETKPESVIFEQVEVEKKMLRFSWRTDPKYRSLSVVILVTFPHSYPAAPPQFLVTSSANDVDKSQIQKILKQTAQQCARKNEPCLSSCINAFSSFMNLIKPLEVRDDFSAFPPRGVSNVPFPRTSGARFCSVGVLICFGRPAYLRRVKMNCDAGTPRSLSALGPFLKNIAHDTEDTTMRRRNRRNEKKKAGLVTIFDVCQLLPFSRELASTYTHLAQPEDRQALCLENEKKALSMNYTRIANTWQAAGIVAKYFDRANKLKKAGQGHGIDASTSSLLNSSEISGDDEDVNWINYHPLGSKLINSIIQHYAFYGDVQTAVCIACLFSTPNQSANRKVGGQAGLMGSSGYSSSGSGGGDQIGYSNGRNGKSSQFNGNKQPGMSSPYHTVHGSGPSDTLHGVVINPLTSDSFFRQTRSNSWSDSLDDSAVAMLHGTMNGSHHSGVGNGGMSHNFSSAVGPVAPRSGILNPSMRGLYDCYKKSYAEILYRWGYLQQRAEVLKCLTEGVDDSFLQKQGVDFVIQCKTCGEAARGPYCLKCKRVVSFCCICAIPAKGLSTYCLTCGHGGHLNHILEWFQKREMCATGCGCKCMENINNFKSM